MPKGLGQIEMGDWRRAKKKTGSKKGQGQALEKKAVFAFRVEGRLPPPQARDLYWEVSQDHRGGSARQLRTVGVLNREECRIVEFHKGFLHWSYRSPGKCVRLVWRI